jgi:hypothetical protein
LIAQVSTRFICQAELFPATIFKRFIKLLGKLSRFYNRLKCFVFRAVERSLFFATQTRQTVRDAVVDAWTKLLQSRQPGGHDIPPKDRGPEMSR